MFGDTFAAEKPPAFRAKRNRFAEGVIETALVGERRHIQGMLPVVIRGGTFD